MRVFLQVLKQPCCRAMLFLMLVSMLVQTAKEEDGEKKGKGGAKRKAGGAAKAPKRQKKVRHSLNATAMPRCRLHPLLKAVLSQPWGCPTAAELCC